MSTVADSLDELSLRLCDLLNIEPDRTTSITLTVEPGTGAVVRWSGYQVVSLEDVGRVLTGVKVEPAPEPWKTPPDPWGTPPDDAGPAGP